MEIYVAGPSKLARSIQKLTNILVEKCNVSLSYDWTEDVLLYEGKELPSPFKCSLIADNDLVGVNNADLFVLLLVKGYESSGAWIEYGYALALNKPVIIVPVGYTDLNKLHENIFLSFNNVTFTCLDSLQQVNDLIYLINKYVSEE